MTDELRINNSLISGNGVINRTDYFVNSLKILGFIFLAFIPLFIGLIMGSAFSFIGGLITGVLCIPSIYLACLNHFKRVRDIRGTTENEPIILFGVFIGLCIPYLGAIVGLILLFKEGSVTGNAEKLDTISQNVSNAINSGFNPKEKSQNIRNEDIENLAKVHELKKSGAITEDEFQKYKNDILNKKSA